MLRATASAASISTQSVWAAARLPHTPRVAIGSVERIRGIYDAWATADFAATAGHFDEHVTLVISQDFPECGVFVGAAGMADWLGRFLENLEEVSMTSDDVRGFGDTVVAHVLLHSKGRASGVAGTNRFFHLFTFRGGKIVRLECVMTEAEALALVSGTG